jgi:EAL domain-containing protein (putative c-di-GMP-specific phosphodiesterase class I)
LETREEDCSIVETIIGLCRRLGMGCTAEGIETEGQFALLARLGCTEAQGYLFGAPQPPGTRHAAGQAPRIITESRRR